ncbi:MULTISPECIES: crotonase/enoyl-CoA hydratase family protein [Variovorax]|jgi:enoyl-CoA hydratase/carnithine racemase|uniref:crotonase/enoyl-CoA hydratase family protein n=1 Tax=Variovorax TaxID=34072 RepID=UPI00086E3603|nr:MULTISPECIES: crotonase/enoyl-CoA hydratase family protein [Variovorax]MBN8758605.1 crotonase/enoyl-CoA hydratase family protein [Variovorax sp.]ODU11643.1 MAG: enoyl-CoA hydratase [Variovorax sp. SCN 67-85]ODV14992.1 MAG: enoyl-CoA hydratase [Variovorax sp. SCN 67-20]OJZ05288.1 MAG: enoyl-CoA hydratase [Variovorax sp. 67-131]UKI05273.1 crotonase/enoyl-CoA hydratase family protein [Variovorax paradoxus]
MTDRIEWTRHADGVVELQLSRADKMNALDPAMFDALIAAGEALRGDKAVRAVVIAGRGKAFCAGLDMASFERMQQGAAGVLGEGAADTDLLARTHGIANAAQQVAMVWREVPVPVIAAVHGVAFGGGLQVALGADIRIVAPETKLSVMEIKWGLVPDMAGMVLMRELARADVVRELTFTGRVFSGEEALQIGFATRLSADPLAEALQMAHEIAAKSPDAIRAGKRLLNGAASQSAADLLMAESVEQQALIGSPNQVEAVKANIERRAPRFDAPA